MIQILSSSHGIVKKKKKNQEGRSVTSAAVTLIVITHASNIGKTKRTPLRRIKRQPTVVDRSTVHPSTWHLRQLSWSSLKR